MSQPDSPQHRYDKKLADVFEKKWQALWDERGAFRQPNPGEAGFDASRPKFYCLDMFPYPSGAGLHVGHPEGYTATDIVSRYRRMKGFNVLHPMGWDAFGLPAEQYAIQTGIHPAKTTRGAIDNFRRQLKRFGFSYDWSREFGTIDEAYYRWTQWIFLRLYGSWYDERAGGARPIAELEAALREGRVGVNTFGEIVAHPPTPNVIAGGAVGVRAWHELNEGERREVLDSRRLAYLDEMVVNWCPKLGTVLANDEVIDGRSERGGFPVVRKPLRQWVFRITAYAERLLKQLDGLDWPASTKAMQAEWIGRSEGAEIEFEIPGTPTLRVGTGAPTLDEIDANPRIAMRPTGFVGRDPYPPDMHGPVDDLIATRRFLPHLRMPDATYFVTWRCAPGVHLSEEERRIVLEALLHFDPERARTFAACVMPDHVHWIVRPRNEVDLLKLRESVKHFSATRINRARGAQGRLWDPDGFDHIVRNGEYFADFVAYVVRNPVAAGLATTPSGYRFTFVHPDVLGKVEEPHAERGGTQTQNLTVFTTRPDTLFGATYMVVAPEHELVDEVLANPPAETDAAALRAYVDAARRRSDVERQESREKTGVFTGVYAVNPATGRPIPVWTADYVLTGYGTGAIMAVPAHDERDFEFATKFGLPIVEVVRAQIPVAPGACFSGEGVAVGSSNAEVSIDGMHTPAAKALITEWLERRGIGRRRVNYKLRDWVFSRQRYWGEPFPIVYDAAGRPYPIMESHLPVKLPELADYAPVESDEPQPLLAKAAAWVHTTAGEAGVDPALLDPEAPVRRETNTMPGSAGSSWYAVRYCDARNGARFVGREAESYWMGGKHPGVDLYVGGSEHAVGHLLYARFWQNVLYDLGEVSTPEPFRKLFHQGLITSFAYQTPDKHLVPVDEVEEAGEGKFVRRGTGESVTQIVAKMSKSLKNVVNPDDVIAEFGADTFRLYEMYMGPLEASKPWNPRDITGLHRFLQRLWRVAVNEETGAVKAAAAPDAGLEKQLHRVIAKVGADIERLSLNTAIAAMIEFVNASVALDKGAGSLTPDQIGRLALVLSPFAPHMAEELWSRLGREGFAMHQAWPGVDAAMLVDDTVEVPVQVAGKVRSRIQVPAGADVKTHEAAAMADARVQEFIAGKAVKKVIVVPGKMVNVVV